MSHVVRPGSAVGVLGGGQLARMFAIDARRMGYRVHTFSPGAGTPAGQVSDVEVRAPYEDLDEVRLFASKVRVVTFGCETVPAAAALAAAEMVEVRPRGEVLDITRNRLKEKTFLSKHGFPCAPFRTVDTAEELHTAVKELGLPAVLKTAAFSCGGQGLRVIPDLASALEAWDALGRQECSLETFVEFEREVSVVAARGLDSTFEHYTVAENEHRDHVLDVSITPARIEESTAREAGEIARAVLESLGVVGVLCIEFFVTRNGELLVNELAPLPHNSGHFSLDACVTSQFEQQLRAACGLPLGSTGLLRPAAMANLLGGLWSDGEPDFASACAFPDVKLHLYGKLEARPGRKMGHLTALAPTVEEAAATVCAARDALTPTS